VLGVTFWSTLLLIHIHEAVPKIPVTTGLIASLVEKDSIHLAGFITIQIHYPKCCLICQLYLVVYGSIISVVNTVESHSKMLLCTEEKKQFCVPVVSRIESNVWTHWTVGTILTSEIGTNQSLMSFAFLITSNAIYAS